MKTNLIYIFLLLPFLYIQAQCTGSFGSPVFTETFGDDSGTGDTYGPALPAGVTTYTYIATNNVQDGQYTVSTSPQNALSNFFAAEDHTSDPSGEGYMLIVNADFSTGEFYRRQVTGLCEGQTFEFSAYLMNILPSTDGGCSPKVPNNVIFRVEDGSGVSLGEIATGNINSTATPQWERYSFDFEVPVGVTDIEVVLINNGPGGCGNDLAIDDISFRACSSLTTVNTNYVDFDEGVCPGDLVDLTAVIEGNTSATLVYQWQESIDGGNTWIDMVGENSVTLSVSGYQDGHMYRYRFYEAVNAGSPNCHIVSEPITVNYYNISSTPIDNLGQCDLDMNGQEEFDLTEVEPQILNGDDPDDYTITYHSSLADAETGTSPFASPTTFVNTSSPTQQVFVRVDNLVKGCAATHEFLLEVYGAPVINSPVDLVQCDDDADGISVFDLNIANSLITTNPAFTITYYNTQTGAENQDSSDEITNLVGFSNATASQVFANISDGECYSIAEVNLLVTLSDIPSGFRVNIDQCDDSTTGGVTNDGIATFDFTDASAQIIAQLTTPGNHEVTYYQTQADAISDINPITNTTNYQNANSPFSQDLYVRVTNTDTQSCEGLGQYVSLSVSQQPEFEVESPQYICLNDLPKTLTVLNPQDDYDYVWYRNGDDQTGVVGLDIIAEVYNPGTYTVVASNSDGTECSTAMEIEVLASSIATITNVTTDIAVPNGTLTINFEGYSDDYEYNIDFLPFEDTNITQLSGSQGEIYTYESFIENPMGGYQIIRVRDRHGCGVAIEEVCVLGFPKFFTPNGDGNNDRWQIFGMEEAECARDAIVNIFDRYGKLLKQFSSGDEGWNGTFNGRQLPASDYWFTIQFQDENFDLYKGHFSLKR